ncbi:MAG: FAD-dependent oxidoreductase, partial [Xanthomonadales bacterium]|nr:FAD-dependent oxidoreductase [Xanthomonadales bacterium]
MKVGDTHEITIVGAGLAGTLLALLLTQRGHRVVLYERNPDPRSAGDPAGRSINLALAERGRHALRCAGLLEQVDRHTIPMRGRMLHDEQGGLTLQPYGAREDEVIYSVHRAQLNRQLLDAADRTGRIRCYFDHALDGIDWAERRVSFTTARGPVTHPFEVLIGTDGGGSRVRRSMQDEAGIEVSEDLLEHGYKELSMPPAEDGGFAMDPNALHIWPRGGFMMIALPNPDRSFTCTCFWPFAGP